MWVSACGAMLALAACSEPPTKPAGVTTLAGGQPVLAAHARPGRHSGHEKYADHGHRPAWGRSGGAAIAAQALVDRSGVADLVVTSYAARDTTTPAGSIVSIAVFAVPNRNGHWKDADAHGLPFREFLHLNGGSSDTVTLRGALPGLALRVVALVRDVSGRRTDVVTTTTVVLKGPDLAVTSMSGASAAIVGLPVLVSAVVSELNGQVGARADCDLYDGTLKVDSAPGVWVDAGSTVTCAFAPTLGTPGPHTLVARAENVAPRDYDLSNNADSVTLTVLATLDLSSLPPGYLPAMVFDARAADVVGSYADTTWIYDFDPAGAPLDSLYADTSDTGRLQTSELHGIIYAEVPFPLARWSLGQTTGGASLDTLDAAAVPGAAGSAGVTCADRSSGGVLRLLCAYDPDPIFPLGHTTLDYVRFAGLVTYESRSYEFVYGGGPCVDSASCWDANAANQATGAAAPWGRSLAITARVVAGGNTYGALAVLPLTTGLVSVSQPKTCSTTTYPFGSHVFCESLHVAQTVVSGSGRGVGTTTSP